MTLLDDAKIITTSNGAKAGTLYSIKPDSGLVDLNITRATTATRVNESGNVVSVAVNEPQIDYSLGGCSNFLIEPQRTNLHLYSEELDNAAYSKSDVTVSANAVTSPDGTTNADECETTSNFAQMYQQVSLSPNTFYTWSFYVKKGTMTDVGQQIFNMNGDGDYGTPGKYYSLIGSDWTRVSFSFSTGANGGNTRFYPINASGVTGSIYLWGFQIEEGEYLQETSYIPTTSGSVTRNKTLFDKTGIASVTNNAEGVLFLEYAFLSVIVGSPSQRMMSIGENNGNTVNIGRWGAGYMASAVVGGTNFLFSLSYKYPIADTNFHKTAVKYKSGDSAIWLDGVEELASTATGTPSQPIDKISSTYNGLANFWAFEGRIKTILYFDTILTDAQLLALTT